MSDLKINVGDEVYLKARVKSIQERPTDDGKKDYYIDLAIPDWFFDNKEKTISTSWSQHLLFTPKGKEA